MTKSELKSKLEDSLEFFKNDITQIRTGRVTPQLLDSVKLEAYGSTMTIREVGNIQVLDPQTLAVTPWDKALLENIAGAIKNSDLSLNPAVRNDAVIIPVPPLTEERRLEFSKIISSKMEDSRQSMRNIRQDAMKAIETKFTNKEFGEDEKFTLKGEVEDIVKEYVGKVEEIGEAKKQDILKL